MFGITLSCHSTFERQKRLKSLNAFTAILCGGLPAIALGLLSRGGLYRYLMGFLIGMVWANAFEYWYHRYLLHGSVSRLSQHHREHHAATGTEEEVEHINFGESPLSVVVLFAVNGGAAVLADLLFGLRIAPGLLAAFSVYFVILEEIHFRIHMNASLPSALRSARVYHLLHHDRPKSRFNVFLPLFDWLCGTTGPQTLARCYAASNQARSRQ